jgi:hypothetical protein
MPRPKKIEPTHRLEIRLRETVIKQLDQALFSEAHGRVPYEARSKLIEALLIDWLSRVRLKAVAPTPAYDPEADLENF